VAVVAAAVAAGTIKLIFLFSFFERKELCFFVIEVENVLAVGSRNWALPNTFRICRKRKFVCLVGFSKRQIFGVSYF
jgi:hypothetical protein